MTIKHISVDSVMLYFGETISESVLDEVQSAYLRLQKLEGIIDLTASYCSIFLAYDILLYRAKEIESLLLNTLKNLPKKTSLPQQEPIKIPTDYTQNLDLERVAQYHHLSIEEVIKIHSQKVYRVYAIGFMLGFAYLAQVDKTIATPRLDSPRKKVPKGSVALADRQTAIYPQDSAGVGIL